MDEKHQKTFENAQALLTDAQKLSNEAKVIAWETMHNTGTAIRFLADLDYKLPHLFEQLADDLDIDF